MPGFQPWALPLVKRRWAGIEKDHVRIILDLFEFIIPDKEVLFQLDRECRRSCHAIFAGQRPFFVFPFLKTSIQDVHLPVTIPDEGIGNHRLLQPISDKRATRTEWTAARINYNGFVRLEPECPEKNPGSFRRYPSRRDTSLMNTK